MRPPAYSINILFLLILSLQLLVYDLYSQATITRAKVNWIVKADSLHSINATVVDEQLNIYVAGSGPKYFPGASKDGIVTKYSRAGEWLWTTYIGGSNFDACKNIALDIDGNIVVTGVTKSLPGFGTDLTAMKGIFVAKLNTDGVILWATNFGGSESIDWISGSNIDQVEGLVTDMDGNIFISGVTESDDLPKTISGDGFRGYRDAFLAKFSSSGALQWNRYYGGNVAESGNALVVDKDNTIWMGGVTSSKTGIALNGFDNPPPDYNSCGFIAQFDQDGQQLWGTHYGGTQYLHSYTEVTNMVFDYQDNLIITGFTTSDSYIAKYGGYDITHNGYYDMFILKMDLNKQKVWATYYGGAEEDKSFGVAVDTLGNIFLSGHTNNEGLGYAGFRNQFNGNGFQPIGLAVKFSSGGNRIWSTYLDSYTSGYKPVKTIASAPLGEIFIANTSVQSIKDLNPLNILNTGYISGSAFVDQNDNCLKDPGELPIIDLIIHTEPDQYFTTTDSTGHFIMAVDLGNYKVNGLASSNGMQFVGGSCSVSGANANVVHELDSINIDFPLKGLNCPRINVDVLRRDSENCGPARLEIFYQNIGDVTAENVMVKIDVLGDLEVLQVIDGQVDFGDSGELFVNVGSVDPAQRSKIDVIVQPKCDIEMNATSCVEASVTYTNKCIQIDPLWDQSDISVQARCHPGGVVRTVIKNQGTGNMIDSASFNIYLDDSMVFQSRYKLVASDSLILKIPTEGKAMHIELHQHALHPVRKTLWISAEGCGSNEQGTVSNGFRTRFPLNDDDFETDIDCQSIRAQDNFWKKASPEGVTENHLIPPGYDIEYTVYFNNPGVGNFTVTDTLDANLDLSTLRLKSSTDPYPFSITGKDKPILTWSIEANTVQAADGVLKFAVKPLTSPDVMIKNRAAIFSQDGQTILLTNETLHQVKEMILTSNPEALLKKSEVALGRPEIFDAQCDYFGEALLMTISGKGFDPEMAGNIVTLNGEVVTVTDATSGTIQFQVSSFIEEGTVSVATIVGKATYDFVITSVGHNNFSENAVVYPNPSSGKFKLTLTQKMPGQKIDIFNTVGESVPFQIEKINAHDIEIEFAAQSGLYFLKITSPDRKETLKVFVQ